MADKEQTVSITDIAKEVALEKGFTYKETEDLFTLFMKKVEEDLLEGKRVRLIPIGTLVVGSRAPRQGRNPNTGETLAIPASKFPRLRASATIKRKLNNETI